MEKLIDGVKIKKLKVIPDERGRLMEILRRDEEIFIEFGQVYITSAYPGVVKAWHCHRNQTDNMVCVKGMVKIVLYDDREESPTKGTINEFFAGIHNPVLIQVPPLVWHGFKCIEEEECLVLNIPTNTYNYEKPDELRKKPSGEIPYDWKREDG